MTAAVAARHPAAVLLRASDDAIVVIMRILREDSAWSYYRSRSIASTRTMVYTHVLNRGPLAVRSPVDRL